MIKEKSSIIWLTLYIYIYNKSIKYTIPILWGVEAREIKILKGERERENSGGERKGNVQVTRMAWP